MGDGCRGSELVEGVVESSVLEGGVEVGEGFTLEPDDSVEGGGENVTTVLLGEWGDDPRVGLGSEEGLEVVFSRSYPQHITTDVAIVPSGVGGEEETISIVVSWVDFGVNDSDIRVRVARALIGRGEVIGVEPSGGVVEHRAFTRLATVVPEEFFHVNVKARQGTSLLFG